MSAEHGLAGTPLQRLTSTCTLPRRSTCAEEMEEKRVTLCTARSVLASDTDMVAGGRQGVAAGEDVRDLLSSCQSDPLRWPCMNSASEIGLLQAAAVDARARTERLGIATGSAWAHASRARARAESRSVMRS